MKGEKIRKKHYKTQQIYESDDCLHENFRVKTSRTVDILTKVIGFFCCHTAPVLSCCSLLLSFLLVESGNY